ncbi:MAG: YkgJ family cysteine cluster protein [Planctomycetes bacterium]|nr:YkgJ family cysteine cluster protein [Planctomycetota bacterium]
MADVWYEDGLRFGCRRCGGCCTGAPGHVWVTLKMIDEIAGYLGLDRDRFGRRYLRKVGNRYSLVEKAGGDCIFFDRGCRIYPVRPLQCRTYPFWPENLRSRSAWELASRACPGIGVGRLYTLEEIQPIRKGEADASRGD